MSRILGLLKDESGATAIEYAIIALLVSLPILFAATETGQRVYAIFASLPGYFI